MSCGSLASHHSSNTGQGSSAGSPQQVTCSRPVCLNKSSSSRLFRAICLEKPRILRLADFPQNFINAHRSKDQGPSSVASTIAKPRAVSGLNLSKVLQWEDLGHHCVRGICSSPEVEGSRNSSEPVITDHSMSKTSWMFWLVNPRSIFSLKVPTQWCWPEDTRFHFPSS